MYLFRCVISYCTKDLISSRLHFNIVHKHNMVVKSGKLALYFIMYVYISVDIYETSYIHKRSVTIPSTDRVTFTLLNNVEFYKIMWQCYKTSS